MFFIIQWKLKSEFQSLNIYIFFAVTLDESIFLDVLHFPMKNIKSRDLEATPMGGATSKPTLWRCLFTLVVVTLVAYRHDVRREHLTFWLFQNYVKSDLMSNNMKMNWWYAKSKIWTLINNIKCKYKYWNSDFSFHWMMKNISCFNVSEKAFGLHRLERYK